MKPLLIRKYKAKQKSQHLFSCIEWVRIFLSLWRQVQSGFQSVLVFMKIKVCHELYETTQTMVCYIWLNLCISYIHMALESVDIKVKTNVGKVKTSLAKNKIAFFVLFVYKNNYQIWFHCYKIWKTFSGAKSSQLIIPFWKVFYKNWTFQSFSSLLLSCRFLI